MELELNYEGLESAVAHTGSEGLVKFREQEWDLVLLDLVLPEIHRLDVLKRILSSDEKLPIAEQANDEFIQMGMTLNEMKSLLEETYLKQEEFVSGGSIIEFEINVDR